MSGIRWRPTDLDDYRAKRAEKPPGDLLSAEVARRERRGDDEQQSESRIQQDFMRAVREAQQLCPILRLCVSYPAGAHVSDVHRQRLTAEGMMPGVPDVLLLAASLDRRFVGLALEFKSPKGKLTRQQALYHSLLRAHGWRVEVVRDADTALGHVWQHLGFER